MCLEGPQVKHRAPLVLGLLLCLVLLSILLSLGYGKGFVSLLNGFSADEGFGLVLRKIRIPRTIMAFLVGGALGICGVALQSMLRNPMAEPYTLGISGGASFGVALATITGLQQYIGMWANPVMGFGGAMLSVAIVYGLSRKRSFDPNSMVLFGIVVSLVFSSFVFFLFCLVDPDKMQVTLMWLMGDLSSLDIAFIPAYIPLFLVPSLVMFLYGKELDILSLGREKAQYLGVDPPRLYRGLFLLSSILTGMCVVFIGDHWLCWPHRAPCDARDPWCKSYPPSYRVLPWWRLVPHRVGCVFQVPPLPGGAPRRCCDRHPGRVYPAGAARAKTMKEPTIFSVRNLAFGYGLHQVLRDVNLDVTSGEIIGIIGPNGAGKSTLLRLLAGYLKPNEGSIAFSGRDLKDYNRRVLAQNIATLPQAIETPFSYTVEEFVIMGRYPHAPKGLQYERHHVDFTDDVMEAMKIMHLRGRRLDALSEGERQRVYLAQCLAQEPVALLLDEPVSHLDIRHQVETLDMLEGLHEEGLTIVMVLHDLNLASDFCSRVMLLAKGTLQAAGSPETVLTFQNIEQAYNAVVIVRENPISGKPFVIPVSKKYLKKD